MTSAPADPVPVVIHTDGGCTPNPGPGGWGAVLRFGDKEKMLYGGEPETTNNRMELMAAIEGLRGIKKASVVDLYSDSQYVINGLKEWVAGWKRQGWTRGKKREPVQNVDLWKTLDELRNQHTVRLHWVRGHNDHPENERCDKLAVAALQQFK